MADVSNPGLSVADVLALIASTSSTSFVSTTPMTINDLLTNYPAQASRAGQYARVSNLFNGASAVASTGVDEIVRCRYDATQGLYRWVPQREAYNISMPATNGTASLVPLVTPPTIRFNGTLAGNLTITPSATNAYVGQRFTVIQNSVLGLFVTSITGLLGSNITLLGGATQDLEYTASGWVKGNP